MPPESSERPLLDHALWLLSGMAGLAIILGLLTYSLIDVVGSSGKPAITTGAASNRTAPQRFATFAPGATGPSVATAPSELLIFILCEGETVASAFKDLPYHMFISLRPATDRDVIQNLLAGTESRFPPDARVYRSNCAEAGVQRGDFP